MYKLNIILAVLLLLANGIGALYGSWHLILHPDGSSIHMPLSHLAHAPFKDYLIPGIVLFFANGVFSFIVISALWLKARSFPVLLMIQGAILFGWIVIQCIMFRNIAFLHILYGSIGLSILALGWFFYLRSSK